MSDELKNLDYWELRKIVSKIVPRMTQLYSSNRKSEAVREKGRKKNYSQFNLRHDEWRKQERLLNTEEINSFLEISVRAAACPMPFNMDIWDGLFCFPPDTQILMADRSYKAIQFVKKGDSVLSYNEVTKKLEPAIVTQLMGRQYRNNFTCVETEDGHILKSTHEHPYLTEYGWQQAQDLLENEFIFTHDGDDIVKTEIIRIYKERIWKKGSRNLDRVYNFEVTPNNNYIANDIIVHNCNFGCKYCFANNFRASLYTAFFDNSKTMGLRHCNPDYYKTELDKMAKFRAMSKEDKQKLSGTNKAFALDIPLRMGIRFEDFTRSEQKHGISLNMLEYLRDIEYPVMLNSKSDLPGQGAYIRALADNKAKTAVHITMITSNEEITKKLEPGAPSYARRLEAIRNLTSAGVRAVPRIEPYLFLLTDDPADVAKYMDDMWEAGARHITFDTYSYTANNSGIRQEFINEGYDYDRMFLAGADSQPLGSLLLGKFMDLFRAYGFSCSTFDMGNSPTNDQSICCEVEDWFDRGWNYGCTVMAARYIKEKKGLPVSWSDFVKYVEKHGGFLTEELKSEVHHLWNLEGNMAYSHRWAAGLVPCGRDEYGIIWKQESTDYRENLIKDLI